MKTLHLSLCLLFLSTSLWAGKCPPLSVFDGYRPLTFDYYVANFKANIKYGEYCAAARRARQAYLHYPKEFKNHQIDGKSPAYHHIQAVIKSGDQKLLQEELEFYPMYA